MRAPRMSSVVERRLLVNYRVDPDAVARLLPSPLRPQVVNGWAVAGGRLFPGAGLRIVDAGRAGDVAFAAVTACGLVGRARAGRLLEDEPGTGGADTFHRLDAFQDDVAEGGVVGGADQQQHVEVAADQRYVFDVRNVA